MPFGAGLLGVGLLACRLVPEASWLASFEHPLRTLPGSPPPETTQAGVWLLMLLLPIAGIAWILAALFMRPARTPDSTHPTRSVPLDFGWLSVVSVILIVGLAIRIPFISQSLWYDEIVAFWYYGQYGPGPIIGNMFTPANHTLQSLGSWASVTLLNGSLDEWVVRFPALLLGLLTAWPGFVLGRRLGGNGSATLLSALILFMPIAVLEGTEARGYAFMLFFGTSASTLLLAAVTERRRELLLIYALVCALGIWGHLVTVVVPIGHAVLLVLIALHSQRQRGIALFGLAGIGLAAVTTLTLLAPVIPDLLAERTTFQASSQDQPTLLGPEGRAILFGLGGVWPISAVGIPGALMGLALVAFGAWAGLHDGRQRTALLLTGLPVLIAILLVLTLGTWIYARFLVFGLTFVAVAITIALIRLEERSRPVATVVAILLLAGWSTTLWQTARTPRQPIREALALIPEGSGTIASVGIPDMPIALSWYLKDPRMKVIDAGEHVKDGSDRLDTNEFQWVIRSYRSRQSPWPEPGSRSIRILPGWIDHMDGGLLVERITPKSR